MKFPISPQSVDPSITKPSKEFIRDTYKVSISILGFVVVYCILFILGLVIAIGAGYLGYLLVVKFPGIITLFIGIALILFGTFLVFFLIKFIGSENNFDKSHLHEINKSDEPELFNFIEKVVKEVGSDFPKKIFLSNEVNAYVFYNSNFWSLFFPVKKNLVLGLGLINSINLSEFKAILAHEFGHFSQKSMKLGSYIYYVNRVIHNMLYDNESFERYITNISEANGYLALAGGLTFMVVRLIQFVLELIYKPINAMYLSLSREMEFHADAVSASVTGGNHLVSSLRRLEMSDICYNVLMSKYTEWGVDNFKSENIYSDHKEVQKHYAKDHDLKFNFGFIDTTSNTHFIDAPRVEIKNQWASHPTLRQRTEFLNNLNLTTESVNDSPWNLFVNPIEIQKKFTDILFENVSKNKNVQILEKEKFLEKYYNSFEEMNFPKDYHGFFDNYFPDDIELKEATEISSDQDIEVVINKKEIKELLESTSIFNDLNLLQFIIDGNGGVKSFDFDGEKYKANEAKRIFSIIEKESNEIKKQYEKIATRIFSYFFSKAKEKGIVDEFKTKFEYLFSEIKNYADEYEIYQSIQSELAPIYQGGMSVEKAEEVERNVQKIEIKFKEIIRHKIELKQLEEKDFKVYLESIKGYFVVDTFIEKNLELLISVCNIFIEKQSNRIMKLKKEFLEYQLEL